MQKNRITQSIIIGLTTLISTATWSGLEGVLSKNGNWILPVVGFFILLIFLSLNWILTKSKVILLITLFFVLISFLFSFGFKLEYFSVLLVSFLLFYLASQKAIDEKRKRIKIEVIMVLKRGLPFILTGLALIISTAYYFSPLALSGQNEIIIPKSLFDNIADPIGINLDIKNNIYEQINNEINKKSEAYKEYFTLGSAIGMFFALKIIGILFMWITIFLSWIIFKILVATGAIKIQEQAVLREVIEV